MTNFEELIERLQVSTVMLRDLHMGWPPKELSENIVDAIRRNVEVLQAAGRAFSTDELGIDLNTGESTWRTHDLSD